MSLAPGALADRAQGRVGHLRRPTGRSPRSPGRGGPGQLAGAGAGEARVGTWAPAATATCGRSGAGGRSGAPAWRGSRAAAGRTGGKRGAGVVAVKTCVRRAPACRPEATRGGADRSDGRSSAARGRPFGQATREVRHGEGAVPRPGGARGEHGAKGRAGYGERVLTPAWHGIEEGEERGGGERGGAHIGA